MDEKIKKIKEEFLAVLKKNLGPEAEVLMTRFENESGDACEAHKIPTRTVPAKKEWIKRHKELEEMLADAKELEKKMSLMHRHFWSTIELALNTTEHMHLNEKTNEVEIYEKPKAIKSPFV